MGHIEKYDRMHIKPEYVCGKGARRLITLFALTLLCVLSSGAIAYIFPYQDGHITGDSTTIVFTIPQSIRAQLFGTVRLTEDQERRLGFHNTAGTNTVVVWMHFDARGSKGFCCCSHFGLQLSNIGLLDDMRHVVIPQGLPDRTAERRIGSEVMVSIMHDWRR